MNPGGPGESGVHQVLSAGKHLQIILDSPISPEEPSDGKYFDIIGFDPRGVNNKTPRLRCFPDAFNQQYWLLKFPDYSFLWDYESVLGMEWATAEAMGASCQREGDENDMARYANTAQTASDMLEFVERHGEWRKKTVSVIMDKDAVPAAEQKAIVERTSWKKGEEKIHTGEPVTERSSDRLSPRCIRIEYTVLSLMELWTLSITTLELGLHNCKTLTVSLPNSASTALKQDPRNAHSELAHLARTSKHDWSKLWTT